jgi:D-alanyl-D-alanine dipeptidase
MSAMATGYMRFKHMILRVPLKGAVAAFLIFCCCALFVSCSLVDEITDTLLSPVEQEESTVPRETTEVTTVAVTEEVTTVPPTVPEKITFPVCGKVKLSNQFDWLNIRSGPGTGYPVKGRLEHDTVITLIGESGNFYMMDFLGLECYVSKDYVIIDRSVEPYSMELYAHVKSQYVKSTNEKKEEVNLLDQLVDLRTVDPTIKTKVVFATEENFTGEVLYPLNLCMIQKGTAEKLKAAQALFQKDGYSIIVYDAYRPYSVSVKLFEIVKNPIYIADPVNNPSRHNRGSAVDISLADSTGKEVEMPSPMHTFDSTASRSNPNMSQEARRNMDYMTEIMLQCGFVKYEYEWWHFNDEDCFDYPVTDHVYTEFLFNNKTE